MLYHVPPVRDPRTEVGYLAQGALILAGLTVLTWYVWLGWDHSYWVDPRTGGLRGPYQVWQQVGCVATYAVLAVLGGIKLRPFVPLMVMPLTFTVAWTISAYSSETVMWAVEAVMIFVTACFATAVFGAFSVGVRRNRHPSGRRFH